MIEFLTSDPAIVIFASVGLVVTAMNILSDARAQRAKFVVTRPVLVKDLPRAAKTRKIAA
jgi:hypothetical protein